MKIAISYSLYGDGTKYLEGALENARLKSVYEPLGLVHQFFWVDQSVPAWVVWKLRAFGATALVWDEGEETRFSRLRSADALGFDAFFIRDVDSRPSTREVNAMLAWQKNSATFHVMRDHPYHYSKVMGGMWGGLTKGFKLDRMGDLFREYRATVEPPEGLYGYDQRFLADVIWPRMLNMGVLQHDTFCRSLYPDSVPFPDGDGGHSFVGEIFEAGGVPVHAHRSIRKAVLDGTLHFCYQCKHLVDTTGSCHCGTL